MAEKTDGEKKIECRLCRKEKAWRSPYQEFRNEISDWSRICNDCTALWELGKKTVAATKADGKDTQGRVHIEVPTDPHRGKPDGATGVRGKDIMTAMGGVSLRGTAMGNPWRGKGDKDIVDISGGADDEDGSYIGGGSLDFKVPKARAEAMRRVVVAFYNAIAKARVDGFNEGRNLLRGLAEGSVRIEDYSEQADNARAGKKPKKRGY